MLCIYSENTDPYFNLAAEEYYLRNSEDEYFMLWQSDRAVITGKHQNALAEVNFRYINEHGISVARRLTGGGTVFHDRGNVNFSFIRRGEPGKLVDFVSFVEPVINFLKTAGISATIGAKHEILVNGRKISGNAEHVFKNRVLHHGTLLFNSDMNMLKQSINRNAGIYTDKSVQSNRSSVMNLSEILKSYDGITGFKNAFFSYITGRMGGVLYNVHDASAEISMLADEKFRNWDWIYGWSPDYHFANVWRSGELEINIELDTHRGIIIHCSISCKGIHDHVSKHIMKLLTGKPHRENLIRESLIAAELPALIGNREQFEDIVYTFF